MTVDQGIEELVRTRRALHGVAECLLAGPEHRASGEIALRVTADGFATTAGPAVRLAGSEVVGPGGTAPLAGTFGSLAAAVGVAFGAPELGYPDGSGVAAEDRLEVDAAALGRLLDWFALSDAALRQLAPEEEPVLWPEHFDVAILLHNRSYGSSPGDDFHPRPYAYVSARDHDGSPFFNAPFGAVLAADEVAGIADLLTFWREGRERLRG